jgi:hypothetical protein
MKPPMCQSGTRRYAAGLGGELAPSRGPAVAHFGNNCQRALSAFELRFALGFWILVFLLASAATASAYPEFQQFIVKHSGRGVNCAFCHAHADGPEGAAPGQIGHLTAAEQAELGRARAAFEPNAKPANPILNAFGNDIINRLGKKRFLELRLAPAQLAEALPQDSDLDGDGIPDAQEFLAGTHPLIASDGNPWRLFRTNLQRNLPQILLTLAATVLGLYGLTHLLRGFAAATQKQEALED